MINPYKLICTFQDYQGRKKERLVGYFNSIEEARKYCVKGFIRNILDEYKYYVGSGEIVLEKSKFNDGLIHWHTLDWKDVPDRHYICYGYFYCMKFEEL